MSAMPSPAQSEFSEGSLTIKPSGDVPLVHPADPTDRFPSGRQSFAKRAPLALARFLITFCVGVGAVLAWQSYGDTAREMIADASPQLAWLAPPAAPVAQEPADPVAPAELAAPAAPAAPSSDQRQLGAVSLDLDAVRQSVDRIAANQEQMTRTISQLVTGQEQMTREIAKLQAMEQYILYKNSEPPSRPAAAPAPRPATRPSPAPAPR
jgi:hypothetical protein